jgi:hypothetical protein
MTAGKAALLLVEGKCKRGRVDVLSPAMSCVANSGSFQVANALLLLRK